MLSLDKEIQCPEPLKADVNMTSRALLATALAALVLASSAPAIAGDVESALWKPRLASLSTSLPLSDWGLRSAPATPSPSALPGLGASWTPVSSLLLDFRPFGGLFHLTGGLDRRFAPSFSLWHAEGEGTARLVGSLTYSPLSPYLGIGWNWDFAERTSEALTLDVGTRLLRQESVL
jgi:hypothetical protein